MWFSNKIRVKHDMGGHPAINKMYDSVMLGESRRQEKKKTVEYYIAKDLPWEVINEKARISIELLSSQHLSR